MAHRWVGAWKIYTVKPDIGSGPIGLSDDSATRSRLKIKNTSKSGWQLIPKKNVDWVEEVINLTPDPENDPTTLTGTLHIKENGVPVPVKHSVTIQLNLSEDDVLDDELNITIKKSNNVAEAPIAQGTANAGRG